MEIEDDECYWEWILEFNGFGKDCVEVVELLDFVDLLCYKCIGVVDNFVMFDWVCYKL